MKDKRSLTSKGKEEVKLKGEKNRFCIQNPSTTVVHILSAFWHHGRAECSTGDHPQEPPGEEAAGADHQQGHPLDPRPQAKARLAAAAGELLPAALLPVPQGARRGQGHLHVQRRPGVLQRGVPAPADLHGRGRRQQQLRQWCRCRHRARQPASRWRRRLRCVLIEQPYVMSLARPGYCFGQNQRSKRALIMEEGINSGLSRVD